MLILYMGVKCGVHVFSISCFVKCGVDIFTGSFGSSGSPVHLRTRNNLYCVKCWYI